MTSISEIKANEYSYVEKPFLEQLRQLGWTIVEGNKDDVSSTFRTSFTEVILPNVCKKALKKLNPFLEEDQVEEVLHELQRLSAGNLFEANQKATQLLIEGTHVDKNRVTGEKSPKVHIIDFENPQNNDFLAINQFKVNIIGTEKHIIPDIVLFINGLPIGVVEAKSPIVSEPMEEAINQLMRYSNTRGAEVNEGNERLFYFNQFMVATSRQEARVATIKAPAEFYLERKDSYPTALSDLHIPEDTETVNSQHKLVEGLFRKANMTDIIQNFVIFKTDDKGRKIKILCRYQQFRAVNKAVERILDPNLSQEEKGGVVRHTQGSGKSLTMVFLIRKLRKDPQGAKFKVVFLTDRTDLQRQIGETAQSI